MRGGVTVAVVLFDAGGVLVHPDWRIVAREISAAGGSSDAALVPSLAAAEHRVWAAIDTPAIETGKDNARASLFLERVLAEVGVDDALRARVMPVLEDIRGRGQLWEYVPAHVPGALLALRQRGHRLGVVSNANGKMPEKLARLGLAAHFDTIVDSGLEGIEKPDPRLFHIALSRMGMLAAVHASDEAGPAWFVGDIFHIDVVGARAAGMRPVLVDKAGLRPFPDVLRIRRLTELLDQADLA